MEKQGYEASDVARSADLVILNKTDLVSEAELAEVEAAIRTLNPLAPIHRAQRADRWTRALSVAVDAAPEVPVGGGVLGELLTEADVHLCVPHERTARIQEIHLLVIHCLCDGIDVALFGGDPE